MEHSGAMQSMESLPPAPPAPRPLTLSPLSPEAAMLRLAVVAESELVAVIEKKGAHANPTKLCGAIRGVVEAFTDPCTAHQLDLHNNTVSHFLKVTLPILTEALLRRNTLREYEASTTQTLLAIAKLLAQPAPHDIPELCELRNMLLLGPPQTMQFIDAGRLSGAAGVAQHLSHGGYYCDFGVPSSLIVGSKVLAFWPDEWLRAVGGSKAIGHFVQWCQGGQWYIGEVVGYNRSSGEHLLLPETTDLAAAVAGVSLVRLCLGRTVHYWCDIQFKHRLASGGGVPSAHTLAAASLAGADPVLSYSAADVGVFVLLWWSKYQKHYCGRVDRWDSAVRHHVICYEDGDTRQYDMRTKDYALLTPPASVLENAVEGGAASVGAWFRAQHPQVDALRAATEGDGAFQLSIPRPSPSTSSLSVVQLAVVDVYLREGGAEAMFASLGGQPAPISRLLLLHLHLVLSLRPIVGPRFADLVWELKEGVPGALLRYEDAQIKQLSEQQLADILQGLGDAMHSVGSSSRDSMETLRLTMAAKLLVCSQLQKRYLGLSMITEALDRVMPRLEGFLLKRHAALGAPRTARTEASGATVTAAVMDQWLLSNGVVDILFGQSLHQDLAARSDVVLAYMGSRRILTEQHVETLWRASLGVHEAVVRVLHQLMLVVVPVLAPALRMHLFSLIAALPSGEYTEQILHLIKNYTVQALAAQREEAKGKQPESMAQLGDTGGGSDKRASRRGMVMNVSQRQWMGFGVLWQCVQDPSSSSSSSASPPDGERGSAVWGGSSSGAGAGAGKKEHVGLGEGFVDLAVQLMIELLQEGFREERELVMQRCLENIQMGVSVPVSLQILRRTLALYPLSPRAWFVPVLGRSAVKSSTVAQQIEKLIKEGMLGILFRDLDAYHRGVALERAARPDQGAGGGTGGTGGMGLGGTGIGAMGGVGGSGAMGGGLKKSRSSVSADKLDRLNDTRMVNGRMGRVSHLRGVMERLDFLRFIISWSPVRLTEQQTMILWHAFGEDAATPETLEKLFLWFNVLLRGESKPLSKLLERLAQESDPSCPHQRSKLAFLAPGGAGLVFSAADDGVLVSAGSPGDAPYATFDEGVLVRLFEGHILPWAHLPKKIELLSRLPVANLCFKLFLLANTRTGAALRVEADGAWLRTGGALVGVPLLWRIALDATDAQVSAAAVSLLIELYHRVPSTASRALRVGDSTSSLLRLCFMHLYFSIQSLGGEGDEAEEESEEWFSDGLLMPSAVINTRIARLICTLRLAVQRFYTAPDLLCTLKVLVGRDESPAFSLVLRSTDKVGYLRWRVARHFRERDADIQLLGDTGGPELLENDLLTLGQARLGSGSIVARKRESAEGGVGAGMGSHAQAAAGRKAEQDLFLPRDLSADLLAPLDPLGWMRARDQGGREGGGGGGGYPLFCLPPFPCTSGVEAMLGEAEDSDWPFTNTVTAAVGAGVGEGVGERRRRYQEAAAAVRGGLRPVLEAAPHYVDQLLEVLDGYLATQSDAGAGAGGTACAGGLGLASGVGAGQGVGACVGVDLSVAVWDILQSLPQQPQLSQAIQAMAEKGDATLLPQLLSPSCPYRLLYGLQIVEALLEGAWGVQFCNMGGAEYVLRLLQGQLEAVAASASAPASASATACDVLLLQVSPPSTSAPAPATSGSGWYGSVSGSGCGSGDGDEDGGWEGMPRKDVPAMTCALLCRVLHRLLLLDPAYSAWHSTPTPTPTSTPSTTSEPCVPSGVVLSGVDTETLAPRVLQFALLVAGQFTSGAVTAMALQAVCENALLLVLGLLTASSSGAAILACAGTESASTPASTSASAPAALFQAWLRACCVQCPSRSVRRAACRRVFDFCASVFLKCAMAGERQACKAARLRLCDLVFAQAVGVCEWCRGEELFSMVAAVQSLKTAPALVLPLPTAPPPDDGQDTPPGTVDAVDRPADPPQLVSLFVHTLVRLESVESFHSAEADGTLLGVLRVLLVLADGDREEMGAVAVRGQRLIPFLYEQCLFPPCPSNPASSSSSGSGSSGRSIRGGRGGGGTVGSEGGALAVEAKCQTAQSRELAYALLLRLCDDCAPNLAQLVQAMGGGMLAEREQGEQVARVEAVGAGQAGVGGVTGTGTSTGIGMGGPGTWMGGDESLARLPLWSYDPSTLVRDPSAFVGLTNQGGTCYMNALLQCLFHQPAFTRGLLKIRSEGTPAPTSTTTPASADDKAVLFQLQVIFGFMTLSQKRFCDTLPFCRIFKDYDGEPVSLSEQKDINEFAGMLFDKLESNKEAAALLRNNFQGTLVWKTKSLEDSYRSEREESFYMLTAEVKDKACLQDSLELFVAEELFSGDNKIQTDAGNKVDALRHCALRALPPVLIVHLKRFEFDLGTLTRKKVNDFIAFPYAQRLDMFPYTEEGLAAKQAKQRVDEEGEVSEAGAEVEAGADVDEVGAGAATKAGTGAGADVEPVRRGEGREGRGEGYYQYRLKGVVAHVGAIDRGHYYSFIRDAEGGAEEGGGYETEEGGDGSWREFNDRTVLPFSAEAIPSECFGGKEDYLNRGVSAQRVRENSAYLLVYEQVRGEAMEEDSSHSPPSSCPATPVPPRAEISPEVQAAVLVENAEFQRDRFLFHSLHFAFLWQLLQMRAVGGLDLGGPVGAQVQGKGVLSQLVLVGVQFLVETLARTRAQACVHLFLERIEGLVTGDLSGSCAGVLLSTLAAEGTPSSDLSDLQCVRAACHPWLSQLLIFCPQPATSKAFLRLLLTCMRVYNRAAAAVEVAEAVEAGAEAAPEAAATAGAAATLEATAEATDAETDSAGPKIDAVAAAAPAAPAASAALISSSSNSSSSSRTKGGGGSGGRSGVDVSALKRSPVARLLDKLLSLAEQPHWDYLGASSPSVGVAGAVVVGGYELRCLTLLQFAILGAGEQALLVQLGAVRRVVCSVLAAAGSTGRSAHTLGRVRHAVELAALLLQRCILCSPNADSPTPGAAGVGAGAGAGVGVAQVLGTEELLAFVDTSFLEIAVLSSPHTSQALQHVCIQCGGGGSASAGLLDFLSAQVMQAAQPASGTLPSFRPFLQTLEALLLGPCLAYVFQHQNVVGRLAGKAQALSVRQAGADCELAYCITALLHRLAVASVEGHGVVLRCRDQWKGLAGKFANSMRRRGAKEGGGTGGSVSKVASAASAYLLN